MKRFLIGLMIMIGAWFAFDRIGGLAMGRINGHAHDMVSPKVKYVVNDLTEDVVFLGTSRCNGHYVSSIIGDTLGMSVYNAGIDGSDNIYPQYMALCHIIDHKVPKVVCLEMQNSFVEKEDNPFRTTSFFAPYFGKNEQADSVYHLSGDYYLYHLSHLYRYNALAIQNITGMVKNRWTNESQGYMPNVKPPVLPEMEHFENITVDVDSMKMEYMDRFVNLCRKNGIKLVFTISPAYATIDKSVYRFITNYAEANDIPLLNYHSKGLFLDNPDYFRDSYHLWDEGAKEYSSIVASDLKRIIREENTLVE